MANTVDGKPRARATVCAATAPTAKVGAAHTIQPPFLQRQYEQQARGFSEQRLRTAYAALVRLDSDLKGGSAAAYASPFMAIQRWILDTCGALPGVDPRV